MSLLSAVCILLGAVSAGGFLPLIEAQGSAGGTSVYGDMAALEKDFSGYFYDNASANINSSAVLISDETVSSMEKAAKYESGGYTSLADYLFSFDAEQNLVRDMDYGTYGNRKTGFLYYKERMCDFEISFDYRYSRLTDNSWKGIYIGFGAERKGEIWANDANAVDNRVIFLQPQDHNMLCGSTAVLDAFKKSAVNYAAAQTKYLSDTDGTAWYSFTLRVSDGRAQWYIDNALIASAALEDYSGGYIYFGTMTGDTAFRNLAVTNLDSGYADISAVERDFKAAFYDSAAASISSSSTLVTDQTITELEKYDRYVSGGYTSLADYLFSVDADGCLVRDVDYGTSGDKKIGFLYYNTLLTDFTIEFEYRHNVAATNGGRKSIYVGYGAQEIGGHFLSDEMSGAIRIQPAEMYSYSGGRLIKNYSNDADFIRAAAEPYYSDVENGTSGWYTFRLTVSGGVVTWSINGKSFSESADGYVGGYVYITAMTQNTAFRNIKITEAEQTTDTSSYTVYYAPCGTRLTDGAAAQQTDFENCWSLDDGVFTRVGTGEYAAGSRGNYGESLLYFSDQRLDAFTLELDYAVGADKGTWLWAAVGFGADEPGSHYAGGDGYLAFIEQEGYISYYSPNGTGTASGRLLGPSSFDGGKNTAYYNDIKTNSPSSWHHLKLTVQSGMMTVCYDDYSVQSAVSDYSGYVYLMCFTPGMKFKNVSVTELADYDLAWAEDYTAYYMPKGEDLRNSGAVFTETDITNVWAYQDGEIVRSGTGSYAGGPGGVQGEAALYFKQRYTDFALEFDYSFAGATATWKWASAGFGADAPGGFFGSDGSFLAFIEQEGYRSYKAGSESGRIAGQLAEYEALVKSSSGDSTWHHFTLVVTGQKMQLSLDHYGTVELALENYGGGYVSILSNTPGMKFRNISIEEISYIRETAVIDSIVVPQGTAAGALPLPAAVGVTLSDGSVQSFSVKEWKCADYNPQIPGNYVFTGELDLVQTGVYEKDSGRFVRAAVTVADYDTSAVTQYPVLSEKQLDATFDAYYVTKDETIGKDGAVLKSASASALWDVTDAGGVLRSGVGEYDGTTSGHKGAALLYFKQQYNEFELDFDYCFNGTTSGHKWMAFGVGASAPGKTYYDVGGGSLFCIEQEGQIRMLGAEESPLITAKSAFAGYTQTLSDKTLSLTTWHHVKIAVKASVLYVFLDDYPVAAANLDGYRTGYIYLLGCTKNLELRNFRISQIRSAQVIETVPYRSVPVGTAADEIALPDTLAISVDGAVVQCPVEWSSADYNGGIEGTYIFYASPVGKYAHYWLSERSKRAIASVSVGSFDSEITQKFALTSFEELSAYFTNYYSRKEAELTAENEWKRTDVTNTWVLSSDGALKRGGTGSYAGGAKGTFGVSALYYNTPLKNFEISFDYRHGTSGWRWFQIGFGAKRPGDTYADSGYLAYVEREGDITLSGSTNGESLNFANPFPSSRFMEGYYEKVQRIWDGSDEWCHMRLSVHNGVLRIYVDDQSVWKCSLAEDYSGGYVYLLANAANSAVKNLSITNFDAKPVDIVSMQTAENMGCAYQTVDKTKDESLVFPDEVIVTDSNGYSYRLPIDWVAPSNYRSGIPGSYVFRGVPVMPSAKFRNPGGIYTTAQVVITKVDYNTANTIKYYFDHENDLLDFTNYYSADVTYQDLEPCDWRNQWTLVDGKLQRIDDDFKKTPADKFRTYKKISRLTYNTAMQGNYQIDVDYLQDTATWMWAMLCFSIQDKTKFMVSYSNGDQSFIQQPSGGTAVYVEREGYVDFWGNMAQANLEDIRIRATVMSNKFAGYDHKQQHHMRLTFIGGVARLWIDDYETSYAARIPDAALGDFIALLSNSNAVTFDNFAITRLPADATEGVDIDTDEVSIVSARTEHTVDASGQSGGALRVLTAVLITAAAVILFAVSSLIFYRVKKNERK